MMEYSLVSLKDKIHKFILKNNFLIAVVICLIGSTGNVLHGIFIKFFMKYKIQRLNLYEFLSIRCIATLLILLPFNFKNLKLLKSHFFINILVSLFYGFDVILWNEGIAKVDVNLAVVIMFLVPIWINILSKILLKENSFNKNHLLSLVLCFVGLSFIINKIQQLTINILFIFLNSFVVSFGLVLQKKWTTSRPIFFAIFFNAFILLLLLIGINWLKNDILFIKNENLINLEIIKMALIIVFFDIMEFGGLYKSYSMIDVSYLQPIRFVRIMISSIFSYLFLKEFINLYQFIGISIIISGNSLMIYDFFKKRQAFQEKF